jgi:superfamily II DNA or RNA helicase
MVDALAYVKAARAATVPVALEVSRPGIGAHAWTFFTEPCPAEVARRLGAGLLREAISVRGRMDLSSYDRLFPSQDVLPEAGVGNLIAAPLQGRCRRLGTTVFLDMATMEPHEDQWAYLSSVPRMSPRELTGAVRRLGEVVVGAKVEHLAAATATRIRPPAPASVNVRWGAGVSVDTAELTPAALATLKHAASMANPLFYERQRRRMSTWDTPRFLRSYDETLDGALVLPRGLADTVARVGVESGSKVTVIDERSTGSPHEFAFAATLDRVQRAALEAVLPHDLAVLVAPPGSGKTVIACAAIARHATSTLVLVDRKALADQWRAQIVKLLGVKPGQLGGGRAKRRGTIDVAMLQTLTRREDIPDLTAEYGLVVVDECHHIPAAAFEHAVKQISARRWLGLTATPYRRDRLDDLIAQQVGPVRHTITHSDGPREAPAEGQGRLDVDAATARPRPVLHVHPTTFRYTGDLDPSQPAGMAAVYRQLSQDVDRNTQIVTDVLAALELGKNCLVLTQWTRHLDTLAQLLVASGREPVVLRGGMGARARTAALARIADTPADRPVLVVATGPYIGEGFDCPALDTLFLTAPIAFKGRLVQYAGRILRPHPGKTHAEVHDYHDTLTGVLASSLTKRAPGYISLGFPDPRRL